ncbi:MAG: nuclear transport factor 2 family protein [Alistipes senegalensis]|nr:nuclear transport factor 2 family protein [Oxalobacter formigenes]MCM1281908.1 nuclear transport factor 2 family protein [Alistipes senegalensis]
MKKSVIALLIAPLLLGAAYNAAAKENTDNNTAQATLAESCQATPQEHAGITKAIDYYIQAGKKGDSRIAQKGFAPAATMSWAENNTVKTVPIKTLYAYFDEKPRTASGAITACSIAGNIAMARVESAFDGIQFTDMFTLVKEGENWKIVSKVYHLKK